MKVYRIAKDKYIRDLTGIGAKTVGGRWNFKGVGVLYCSSTASLCMLECLAHFPVAFAPSNMALATISIPEDSIKNVELSQLPNDWQEVPSPRVLKEMGRQWVDANESIALRVPSTIVPQEYNLILNPLHPDFSKVKLDVVEPFEFDGRVL